MRLRLGTYLSEIFYSRQDIQLAHKNQSKDVSWINQVRDKLKRSSLIFPRLAPVACFPALSNGYLFFLRLTSDACFPRSVVES